MVNMLVKHHGFAQNESTPMMPPEARHIVFESNCRQGQRVFAAGNIAAAMPAILQQHQTNNHHEVVRALFLANETISYAPRRVPDLIDTHSSPELLAHYTLINLCQKSG